MTGNKWLVTKTENNPSYVELLLNGLSKTREVTWGNIPGSSEVVARIVSSSDSHALTHRHTHTHKHTHFDT